MIERRYAAERFGCGWRVWDREQNATVGDCYPYGYPTSRKAAERYAQWLNRGDEAVSLVWETDGVGGVDIGSGRSARSQSSR